MQDRPPMRLAMRPSLDCVLISTKATQWLFQGSSCFGAVPAWVGPQQNAMVRWTVLARLMESVRNGATSLRPARWKESKERGRNGANQYFCPWIKFQQIPALPAHSLKLVNVSPSHMTEVLFKLLPLHWNSERVQPLFPRTLWLSQT